MDLDVFPPKKDAPWVPIAGRMDNVDMKTTGVWRQKKGVQKANYARIKDFVGTKRTNAPPQ
jgi:hypothetical protein